MSKPKAVAVQSCKIALPLDFRKLDFLEFHGRDKLEFAEKVSANRLEKGLVWKGHPACLRLEFQNQTVHADLFVDDQAICESAAALAFLIQRMLGLNQNIEAFIAQYHQHPQLQHLIASHPGLRVPLSASPFEAISWAITGQQISVGAATSLRRKLIQVAGVKHSSGIACYPDASRVAGLSVEDFRQAGFSNTKAQAINTLSQMVHQNQLPLDDWITDPPPVDEICERLLGVRGIGPWTVNYALLRGFGWLDGSLHGDAAVRRGLQSLLTNVKKITEVKVSEAQAQQWLAEFSPWRALVAAHLWALSAEANDPDV